MDNFFALEPLLIVRLKGRLGNRLRAVLSGADIEGLKQLPTLSPAAYVLYDRYDVVEQPTGMPLARLRQQWLVVLAIAHARAPRTGEEARSAAGPLLADIINILSGWRPSAQFNPLMLASPPAWDFNAGLLHFPIAFTTTFTIGASS